MRRPIRKGKVVEKGYEFWEYMCMEKGPWRQKNPEICTETLPRIKGKDNAIKEGNEVAGV